MVQDISGIKELWKDVLYDIFPLLVIIIIVSIIIMLSIARSINKPLANMIAVVQDIEQNSDLSERVASSYVLELNHLAQAFNSMLEKFQNIIADASHVSLSSTQAADIAEDTSESAQKGCNVVNLSISKIN